VKTSSPGSTALVEIRPFASQREREIECVREMDVTHRSMYYVTQRVRGTAATNI
jgi:hypothetical protein